MVADSRQLKMRKKKAVTLQATWLKLRNLFFCSVFFRKDKKLIFCSVVHKLFVLCLF